MSALNSSNVTSETVLALLRRHIRLFAAIFFAIFGLAVLVTVIQTPKYEATSRILIDPRRQAMLPNADVMSGLPPKDQSAIDTEVEVLYSSALTRRVVKQLGLNRDAEFSSDPNDVAATADAVSHNLDVRRVGETYLIDIAFISKDAEKAARIANTFADDYIGLQTEVKRTANKLATVLLGERVKSMAEKVKLAEVKVQQFKIANGLMSVNGTTLAEQSIASIDNDLARARAEELEAFGRLSAAQRAGARLDASTSTALQELRSKQAIAQQELGEAQLKYGEKHPAYQAAVSRVEDLNRAIAAETRRAQAAMRATVLSDVDKLRAEAAAAAQKRQSLAASVDATREALTSTNRAQVALNDLERDAQALRATYESYLNRYQETLTKEGTETPDARIVSDAFVPRLPVKPNVKLNLALGAILGFATAISVIVLLTLLDPRLRTADDIEKYLDLDALPTISTLQSAMEKYHEVDNTFDPLRHVIEHPQTVFTEQFRNLLNAIRKPGTQGDSRVIAITSSLPNEGKTTTSICLARVAAMSGLKTVIIDCDLRHRAVNKIAPNALAPGLIEYLRGQVTLQQILQSDEATGAFVIPASVTPSRVSDNLGGARMRDLIAALRASFDLIILDTPPVLPLADARMVATLADSVVMAARWQSTSRRAVEAALNILSASGANIMGVCLTMADLRKLARDGYGDPSFYYSKYKDYYANAGKFDERKAPQPEMRKTA